MKTNALAKHYLITGGAGFIGSHLIDLLLDEGHRVDCIDDLSTGDLSNLSHLQEHPDFHFVRASISEKIILDRLASQADVIVHLAAAVGVKLVVEQPVATIETNIIGTEAILKAALHYGCKVLLASSSEVYGKGTRLPFREQDDVLLGPTVKSRWAYAASKMVDEFLAFAYHREFGLDISSIRLFNTVGPRQTGRYGMVIPRFVRQALNGEPITVYGDGKQTRCFCDVRDVVRAIMELSGHPGASGRVFNIGSEEEISILELAKRVKEIAASDSDIVFIPFEEAYSPGFEDMNRRVPNLGRIQQIIGWQPKHSLGEILQTVLDYHLKLDGTVPDLLPT